MAGPRIMTIKTPVGGIVRQFEFQSTPPFTAVDAVNFWPNDCKTGRRRIATRPGLALVGASGGSAVRGIYALNAATGQTFNEGLLRIAGNALQRWTGSWSGVSYTGGGTFSTDRYIMAAAYNQDLYIANGTVPARFKSSDNSLADMAATEGSLPSSPKVVSVHADRLMWGGSDANPHILQLSRAGDPLDYDYGMTDAGSAWQITGETGGNIGQRVNALLQHNHECTLIGSAHSVSVLKGDPGAGGALELVSPHIGPLGPQAWCKTNDGQTFMITRDGAYAIPPGCGDLPQPLSGRIPDSLKGIDTTLQEDDQPLYEVFTAYDGRFRGVQVYVTDDSSSNRQAWWLDWEDGGWFPMEMTTTEQPLSILRFDELYGDDESEVLLGGKGGGVRRFDRTASLGYTDAYMYIGPIRISPTPYHKSIVQSMNIRFGGNQADTTGTVKVYCAEDGETAYNMAAADTINRRYDITFSKAQSNYTFYPRVGGHAMIVAIRMASGYTSVEEITCQILAKGAQRP